MIQKYLKNASKASLERAKHAPKHPNYSRSVVKDGKVVPVETYDEVPSDVVENAYVSFSTYVEAGEKVPKMGGFSASVNHLSEQRVAEIFLEQFNQLEAQRLAQQKPAPVLTPEPVPAPAPAPASQE